VKYVWIQEHSNEFPVIIMCKIFKVDKSSYYHWIKQGAQEQQIDEKLNELIEIIFIQGIVALNEEDAQLGLHSQNLLLSLLNRSLRSFFIVFTCDIFSK